MAKHKKNNHSILRRPMLPVLALVIGAAALTVAAILSVTVVHERDRLNKLYSQESQHSLENLYWTHRTMFCYENNIRPCAADEITEWNKAHPDDTFSVVVPTLPQQ